MKKYALIAEILCVSLLVSGCSQKRVLTSSKEVENLELVRTVGIDKNEDMVKITVCAATGTEGKSKFFTEEAPTFSQAVNDMQKLPVGKETVFSHTEHIVISEDAARDGIGDYLDYVERSDDLRTGTGFFIAKGSEAGELLTGTTGEDTSVSELLKFLIDNITLMGNGYVFNCGEIASSLSDTGCALILAVSAKTSEGLYEGEAEKTLYPDGFAVIQDGKLTGFISQDEAMGAMLLMGKTRSGDITLDLDGTLVSVNLTKAKVNLTPIFDGNSLKKIKAELDIRGNIVSVSAPLDIDDDEIREKLSTKLSEIEENRVRSAIDASQNMDADFMNIYKKILLKSPIKCQEIEDRWSEILSRIDFEISANSELIRTFDINDPPYTDGKEGKAN
jgi:spore germination protein KC